MSESVLGVLKTITWGGPTGGWSGCSPKVFNDDGQKVTEEKKIVIDRETLYAILNELKEDECSLENLPLSSVSEKEKEKADRVSSAIAQKVLEKSAKFAELSVEAKSLAVKLLAEDIQAKHRNATLADLLNFVPWLSYKSFCNTRDLWYSPTYGQIPDAIALGIKPPVVECIARAARMSEVQISSVEAEQKEGILLLTIKGQNLPTEKENFDIVMISPSVKVLPVESATQNEIKVRATFPQLPNGSPQPVAIKVTIQEKSPCARKATEEIKGPIEGTVLLKSEPDRTLEKVEEKSESEPQPQLVPLTRKQPPKKKVEKPGKKPLEAPQVEERKSEGEEDLNFGSSGSQP